jgi:hypothetical protein
MMKKLFSTDKEMVMSQFGRNFDKAQRQRDNSEHPDYFKNDEDPVCPHCSKPEGTCECVECTVCGLLTSVCECEENK